MNEELKIGDRVMILHMEDERGVLPGTWGTVTKVSKVFGVQQYNVNWDNGTKDKPGDKVISTLAILSDTDAWTTKEIKKRKTESYVIKKKDLIESNESDSQKYDKLVQNHKVFKFFNQLFFQKYLSTLRRSGIVNMFSAPPYLYMGRDRIKHEFKYNEPPDEEAFEELLDMADESQSNMINGVIKVLKEEKKEPSLENINRYLIKYSVKVLENFMIIYKP